MIRSGIIVGIHQYLYQIVSYEEKEKLKNCHKSNPKLETYRKLKKLLFNKILFIATL